MNESKEHPWGKHWEYEPLMPEVITLWTEEGRSDAETEQHYKAIGDFITLRLARGQTLDELKDKPFVQMYYDYLERKKQG